MHYSTSVYSGGRHIVAHGDCALLSIDITMRCGPGKESSSLVFTGYGFFRPGRDYGKGSWYI
jgi:hypothetical protein